MVTKLLTRITREAIKKAKDQHRAKIKSIKAGKGTTSQKIDRMDKANDVLLKKIDQAKGEEFKQSQKMKKKKPVVTRELQTKVLMKAKKNNMTGKNFRMKNPKDKDVQALYKANPNLKKSDASRQEGRDYQKAFKKAKTPAQKVRVINRQTRKQIARDAREYNKRNKYKELSESDLKKLINSRAKNLEMSVSEYKRLKFDNPFVKELNKRKGK